MSKKTKKLTTISLMLALCILGGNIKLLGSIALDSFPAFLSAIILGPIPGAFIAFFGHMISAMLSGFPNTLPIHLVIAFLMMICVFVYGTIRVKWSNRPVVSKVVSIIVAFLISVPLDLVILYPILGEVVFILAVPLTIATFMNLFLTDIVYAVLPSKVKHYLHVPSSYSGGSK
ncbi:TPA: ECF transporter S component [Enterococcus faecalis]|uniref:ECF transporter S component n=2 Tax=Enterococcus faecalis TaxID=1351 RepID=UPI001142027C|nr:ECF transporter S component [Enterococcus faecalis]EHV0153413.1 ECF transporter S component [Enterococcus faecalis]NSV46824.1 ECF transporter S component [Enterococcus faecalis]TQA42029.1 ECF transporter S component [Enterococcus faecalis]HDT8169920.1 ECF transporter S component [Enterococcus faecalis]